MRQSSPCPGSQSALTQSILIRALWDVSVGLFVWFVGHTWLCSGVIPVSTLRTHSCGAQGTKRDAGGLDPGQLSAWQTPSLLCDPRVTLEGGAQSTGAHLPTWRNSCTPLLSAMFLRPITLREDTCAEAYSGLVGPWQMPALRTKGNISCSSKLRPLGARGGCGGAPAREAMDPPVLLEKSPCRHDTTQCHV